jgi:RNA recognition motif-containing protein
MMQVGPVLRVYIPKDEISQAHKGHAFCKFASEEDANYAIKIMNQVKLYGRPLKVNKADKSGGGAMKVGAELTCLWVRRINRRKNTSFHIRAVWTTDEYSVYHKGYNWWD